MKKILTGIADLIYPPRCMTCDEPLEQHDALPFCPSCRAGIQILRSPLCPRCGVPFPVAEGEDRLCGDCLRMDRPYAIARSVGSYEGTLLTAIHRFKYQGKTGIGKILGRIMADFAETLWDMKVFERVVPVPLHRKRLRSRGFNQSVILARALAKRFGIMLDFTSLRREIFTPPQVGLDRKERCANVHGIFTVRHPERIAGRRILLVDDVYTTGSTLEECSRTLIRAKAEAVAVLTLARAVRDINTPPEPGQTLPERSPEAEG